MFFFCFVLGFGGFLCGKNDSEMDQKIGHSLKVNLNINILFSAFSCIQQRINNWKVSGSYSVCQ